MSYTPRSAVIKTPQTSTPAPCLLDEVRRRLRVKHYCLRAEMVCVAWIRQYILASNMRYSREFGRAASLTSFATRCSRLIEAALWRQCRSSRRHASLRLERVVWIQELKAGACGPSWTAPSRCAHRASRAAVQNCTWQFCRTRWVLFQPSAAVKQNGPFWGPFCFTGGEGGIRTHGRLTPTPDFESGTFDHSATSPEVGRE